MLKGETYKDHHQTPRGCRPPGVDSCYFQVCVHPSCAPSKGHKCFTAQALEKHLKSGGTYEGGIGGMVEFLLDPARAKPEGTLAVSSIHPPMHLSTWSVGPRGSNVFVDQLSVGDH